MFKEPDEPSIFDEIQTVVFASPDKIGKVFCALDETMRLCLVCDEAFTREGAAEHANVVCHPRKNPNRTKVHLIRARRLFH